MNTSEASRFVGRIIAEVAVERGWDKEFDSVLASGMQLHVIWRDTNGAIGEWPIEGMTVSELAILIDDVEEVDPEDPTYHSGTYEWTYAYRQRHPHHKYFD